MDVLTSTTTCVENDKYSRINVLQSIFRGLSVINKMARLGTQTSKGLFDKKNNKAKKVLTVLC